MALDRGGGPGERWHFYREIGRTAIAPLPDAQDRAALSRAAAWIAREEGWLPILARLVETDTCFPPGNGYAALADLLEDAFTPLGFAFRRVEVPEPLWASPGVAGARVNLIGLPATRSRPACGIYVHTDTVPAGEGWTRPPLALTREGDALFGRGTADMKGTLAALLLALQAARREGIALAYDPTLLFCTDEEGGLYPGIRWIAEQGLLEGDHLICLNGGAAPRLWAGCFGSLDLAIRIEGRAAHSGDPAPDAVNAVEQALPVLAALMRLKAVVEGRHSALPPPPDRAGRPLTARLTIAAVHGGAKGGSLPGACDILVNRRVMPEETMDAALAELEACVRQAAAETRALSVTTTLAGRLDPVMDPGGPHWPRWQQAMGWGFGWRPEEFRRWGASSSSDMGFVQRAGMREILLGGLVRRDSRGHGPDEFTTMQDIRALARALLAYLADSPIPPLAGDTDR